MTRLRSLLSLLALAALLVSGTPAFAGETGAGASAAVATPALAGELCEEPALPEALLTPAGEELAPPVDPDFILCTCKFCKDYPDVICQISPSGFSILCADYYNWRCV